MNDVEAALGTSQLTKLAQFVEQRNVLAAFYDNAFEHQANITPLDVKSNCYSSYHLYVVRATRLNSETHKIAIETLRAKGIFAHVHYIPIHLQPFYQKLGFKKGDYPHAEQYYHHAITLPLYPSLTQEEAQYIVDTTIDVVNQLSS
jgi:dTDP-4-amino-4,6-dideoxygalactose transaminase